MSKNRENGLMYWKFQAWENFWFFIPEDRDYYWGDFYVSKENFWLAQDWDKVEARELKKFKWKKPEAKIITAYWRSPQKNQAKFVEWIYSWWDWNYWFIDIEWQDKWYFVYWNKKGDAKDWDLVKAELVEFKWKTEAVVVKVLKSDDELLVWRYQDRDRFGFVIPDENKNEDIFIAWSRKNWAKDWDIVEVKIIKKTWKNPEWIIKRILD